jgi:hypothetical protein
VVVDFSVLRLSISVEIFPIVRKIPQDQIGSAEAPELAYTHSDHKAIACVSLKSFWMNLDYGRRLLAVEQRFEKMVGEIGHGSYAP